MGDSPRAEAHTDVHVKHRSFLITPVVEIVLFDLEKWIRVKA
jgi:hypothetical protein